MSDKIITVNLSFSEEYDADEDYTELTLEGVDAEANFPREMMEGVAEHWAQSDFYWVGITQAILKAIGGTPVDRKDIKW